MAPQPPLRLFVRFWYNAHVADEVCNAIPWQAVVAIEADHLQVLVKLLACLTRHSEIHVERELRFFSLSWDDLVFAVIETLKLFLEDPIW